MCFHCEGIEEKITAVPCGGGGGGQGSRRQEGLGQPLLNGGHIII